MSDDTDQSRRRPPSSDDAAENPDAAVQADETKTGTATEGSPDSSAEAAAPSEAPADIDPQATRAETTDAGATTSTETAPRARPAPVRGEARTRPPAEAAGRRSRGRDASTLALFALLVAFAALLLPTMKPWLEEQFGDVTALALLPSSGSEVQRLHVEIATLRQEIADTAARTEAEAASAAEAASEFARIDAALSELAAQLAASLEVPPLPILSGDGASEELQAWSEAASRRMTALEGGQRMAAVRLETTEAELAGLAARIDASEMATGAVQAASDEHGGAIAALRLDREAIGPLRSELAALAASHASDQAASEERNTRTDAALATIRTEIEGMAALRTELASLASDVSADRSATEQTTTRIDAGVAAFRAELETLTTGLDETRSTVAQAADRADAEHTTLRGELKAQLAALRTELGETGAALDGRLAETAEALAATRNELEALAALRAEMDSLTAAAEATEGALTDIRNAVDAVRQTAEQTIGQGTELVGEIGALAQKLARVEQVVTAAEARVPAMEGVIGSSAGAIRDLRLSQSLFHLGAVLETHRPFAREIAFARTFADHGAAQGIRNLLEPIVVYADTGVATHAEMRDSFSAIVAPKLFSLMGDQRPWLDRLRNWMSAAISPGDGKTAAEEDPNDPARQIIQGAIRSLAEEDLETAVALLSQLDGTLAKITQRWTVEARARLALDEVRDRLLENAIRLVSVQQ